MKKDPHCKRGIVAHWSWYCWAILRGGRFNELRPIYTKALARLPLR